VRLNEFVAIAQVLRLNVNDYASETALKSLEEYRDTYWRALDLRESVAREERRHTDLTVQLADSSDYLASLQRDLALFQGQLAEYERAHAGDEDLRVVAASLGGAASPDVVLLPSLGDVKARPE
jgi:hypothetical protein